MDSNFLAKIRRFLKDIRIAFSRLFGKSKWPIVYSNQDRLELFFKFCDGLEQHGFYQNHAGTRLQTTWEIPADKVKVNYDEYHLESLCIRLRQFISEGELFYIKDIRRAMIHLFQDDDQFRKDYNQITTSINKPLIETITWGDHEMYKISNFKELLEAFLYLGPIHSNRLLAPITSIDKILPKLFVIDQKNLITDLAYLAIEQVNNILLLRDWVLQLAQKAG